MKKTNRQEGEEQTAGRAAEERAAGRPFGAGLAGFVERRGELGDLLPVGRQRDTIDHFVAVAAQLGDGVGVGGINFTDFVFFQICDELAELHFVAALAAGQGIAQSQAGQHHQGQQNEH